MTKQINPLTHPVLGFDLDNTLVEAGAFPDVGSPHPGAIQVVNKAVKAGYEVIIWTARGGENLKVVKKALFDEYGMNPNVKINQHSNHFTGIFPVESPKVNVSVLFDDTAYGAPDYSLEATWGTIKEYLGL